MTTLPSVLIRSASILPLLFAGSLLSAQINPSASADADVSTSAKASTVILSPFSVTTTQDKGYVSSRAATAFKTNEELIKIPQAITVVSRDMIEDIGYANSSDVLQFAGVSNFLQGESYALRGSRLGNALIDEHPDLNGRMDNVFIDSYEVIRGPVSVFYPTATIGGIILKNTRKPLPLDHPLTTVSLSVTEYGMYRSEFDSTGNFAKLGNGKLSYRLVAAYQDGKSYFRNVPVHHAAIHPSIEFNNANNKILIATDATKVVGTPFGLNFLTSDGRVYTGAGRKEVYFNTGSGRTDSYFGIRLQWLHIISDNWQTKNNFMFGHTTIKDLYLYPAGMSYITKTLNLAAAPESLNYKSYNYLSDVTGKYDIFQMPARSTFGFTISDRINDTQNFTAKSASLTTSFPNLNIDHPNIDAIHMPIFDDYAFVRGGPEVKSINFAGYFQEELDVIPDRLSLVAGLTWKELETDSISNTLVQPFTSTNTDLAKLLHRYGGVYQIIKNQMSLYAMESTTIFPKSTTARDANGALLPDQVGKGSEIGLKTNLWGEKLVSTIAFYRISQTGQAVFTGYNPAGVAIYAAIGEQVQKGADLDLEWHILPNWQLVGSAYSGSVKDQNGVPVPGSYTHSWSVLTKYDFASGNFKGLSFGAGAVRIYGRTIPSSGITFLPGEARSVINMKPGNLVKVFTSYQLNSHWSVQVAVDNLLDETYAVGAQAATFVDLSLPRTVSSTVRFRF